MCWKARYLSTEVYVNAVYDKYIQTVSFHALAFLKWAEKQFFWSLLNKINDVQIGFSICNITSMRKIELVKSYKS